MFCFPVFTPTNSNLFTTTNVLTRSNSIPFFLGWFFFFLFSWFRCFCRCFRSFYLFHNHCKQVNERRKKTNTKKNCQTNKSPLNNSRSRQQQETHVPVGTDLKIKGGGGSGSGECSKRGIFNGCFIPMHKASGGIQHSKLANNNKINGKGLKSERKRKKKGSKKRETNPTSTTSNIPTSWSSKNISKYQKHQNITCHVFTHGSARLVLKGSHSVYQWKPIVTTIQ